MHYYVRHMNTMTYSIYEEHTTKQQYIYRHHFKNKQTKPEHYRQGTNDN
jgi:hypothetical protein